ncbi:MAG: DUF1592 domain-containing protein [Planctomycetota bacterium]
MKRFWIHSRLVFLNVVLLSGFGQITTADDSMRIEPYETEAFGRRIYGELSSLCIDCHDPDDEDDPVGFLRDQTPEAVARNRGVWKSVAEQIQNRTMPPADVDQPTEAQRFSWVRWIDEHLKRSACIAGPYAGATPPRRLNRDQYTYAIEDLTGLDFDFVETFPADGSGGEGFDNNAETLFLPPLLMERYLEVAKQVTDRWLISDDVQLWFRPVKGTDKRLALAKKWSSLPITPRSGRTGTFRIYREGNFQFRIVRRDETTDNTSFQISIDDASLRVVELGRAKDKGSHYQELIRVRLAAGVHRINIKHLPESDDELEITNPFELMVNLQYLPNEGLAEDRELARESRDRLFGSSSRLIAEQPHAAAKEILGKFVRRAWRREVQDDEIKPLMGLFDRAHDRGDPFAVALSLPLQAILVSPKFLFVAESTSAGSSIVPISDADLASRLSMFLWHSIPDERLLSLARRGTLRQNNVLLAEVDRMLDDPKSARMADHFTSQWLGTDAVGNTKIPDVNFFRPTYTSDLVNDLRYQVGHWMAYMIANDRPVTDFLSSDYVVVNHRLAEHYGLEEIPNKKSGFTRINIPEGSPRGGVVGLGAVHMLTSYARRTSPVLRGGWVLETIFGVHLPAPPPDAGALPGGEREQKNATVRQRLQQHRRDPTCASCHNLIDPIGFAMENYDVLGRWRDKEGKRKIDAGGRLPSGEEFVGPLELQSVLMKRQTDFVDTMVSKMLGFALGRPLEDADACTTSAITNELTRSDFRVRSLIRTIVTSTPFLNRQNTDPDLSSLAKDSK